MSHPPLNSKIVVGISGGVDSAVAALLLKEQGYWVEAAFMKNWEAERNDPYCSADQDLADARAVCDLLDIPLHTVNFSAEYWQQVFQYMLDEYAVGRTPNPDIICNKEIKFKQFLNYAKNELRADLIATGHYARRITVNTKQKLLKGIDQEKDQSYFLYALNQYQLSHALFPIGHLTKSTVREIAQKANLPNFAKKDSTGICFIGERKFKDFLSEYLLAKPGEIITTNGVALGKHDGLMFYTLGQRQGLKIGGQKNADEAPWYVVNKDIKNNSLIVAQEHDHPLLLSNMLQCSQIHWVAEQEPTFPLSCSAKIRYRQQEQTCIVSKLSDNIWQVEFTTSQRAITPGQSVVFYAGEECLGGGIITV